MTLASYVIFAGGKDERMSSLHLHRRTIER